MADNEVQDALLDHVHVAECTVAEVVEGVTGNWMTAFVVTRDDVESDVESLFDHVRSRLPGRRHPDDIQVVSTLPDDPASVARERAVEQGRGHSS